MVAQVPLATDTLQDTLPVVADNAPGNAAPESDPADTRPVEETIPITSSQTTQQSIDNAAEPAADSLNWSESAFELDLDAIARQIVLNSVIKSYVGDTLQLGFLPELEVMLKPDMEKQIKQAIEQQLGVSLKLEFISMQTLDVETPHQAEIRKLEEERQAVIQQIHQDKVVKQLKDVFGAELIEQSVRKRTLERK